MNLCSDKRVFTGSRPTGRIHLGNLATFIELIGDGEVLFMVADLHGMVDGKGSREKVRLMVRTIAGIFEFYGKKDWYVYVQSTNPHSLELSWRLSTLLPANMLRTMVSYKSSLNQNLSLLNYPVLQASDIMIHDVSEVPVGEDQRQHLELYEKLRQRVNERLAVLDVPYRVKRLDMRRIKHKIMDLKDPRIKMSKSNEDVSGIIYVNDYPLEIRNKVRRALSSSNPLSIDSRDAAIENLLSITRLFWPEGYPYLNGMRGKRHFMFKSMLGLGLGLKLSRIQSVIDGISDGRVDTYCEVGLERSRYYSDKVIARLNLIWD